MGEGEGIGWGVRKGSWKREEVKHILGNGKESMFFMKTSRKKAHQFLNEPTNHRWNRGVGKGILGTLCDRGLCENHFSGTCSHWARLLTCPRDWSCCSVHDLPGNSDSFRSNYGYLLGRIWLLAILCTVLMDSLLCPWNFPGKNTGVSCHFLHQGIFLTQGSNLCLSHLLHWQVDYLPLHNLERPQIKLLFS